MVQWVMRWLIELLSAVDALHKANIIHRDIKVRFVSTGSLFSLLVG